MSVYQADGIFSIQSIYVIIDRIISTNDNKDDEMR